MKVSDYIIEFLANLGIQHNFLVSGGAVIHLVDSANKHPHMTCVCAQHEQLGAAAADGYARVAGLGVVMTTSGPGATNLLTSVCNAYFDSVPLLCITGQVSRFRLKNHPQLRQRGFQETDVLSIFKSVTNYATLITNPLNIRYELEKAVYLATHGRHGPVLLDIPDDLQRETIDPSLLKRYSPPKPKVEKHKQSIDSLMSMIRGAKRPSLLIGSGVHAAKAEEEVIAFARKVHLPMFFTWGGADLLPSSDPLNMGVVGVCGPRGNNFGIQFSDLIISFGSRMSQMITGGKQNLFGTGAKKVMVDIDQYELKKFDSSTFTIDLPIKADLKLFLAEALQSLPSFEDNFFNWRTLIRKWKSTYPICLEKYAKETEINPYLFVKYISSLFEEKSIIVGDTGANLAALMQAIEIKKGQKIFSAWNHTPMGYSLPASIGAKLAAPDRKVYCVIGDGGLMMCLQELATLSRLNLPIKIFLFNNKGHAIQKQTIDIWLQSNYVAVDEPSGLCFPNYERLASAFKINYLSVHTKHDFEKINPIMNEDTPCLIDVHVKESQKIIPMLKYGTGIENLDPKISQEELDIVLNEAKNLETPFEITGVH